IAFAYLLHGRGKQLSETAEKRLRAIREFTEFGSGFRIAMRDLEIRGAGNLLGPEQHGHMAAVGYELYCRMVDEAVRALTGGVDASGAKDVDSYTSEPKIDVTIDAFIPESYIEDEADRIDIYSRIAFIAEDRDACDLMDELGDRYGPVPAPVRALVSVSIARILAGKQGVRAVHAQSEAELDAAIEKLRRNMIE
ncbi:MAG: transcription-repair coupling factor, partial [Clostridiales Family XIII bacterium]|nr:transcription-repair coupling factor [Clostridiales Family XIII bacterium]